VREVHRLGEIKPAGELNYGSGRAASSGHLMTELFLSRAGIKMVHVPYPASPFPPLYQGDTHLQFSPIPTAVPWMNDARLRPIGVTSLEPDPNLPGIEPVSRTCRGFDTYEWPDLSPRQEPARPSSIAFNRRSRGSWPSRRSRSAW